MKSRIVQPGTRNLTPTEKHSTSGMKRFVALRQHMGKDPVTREMQGPYVYHDMHANKTYFSGDTGWDIPPPDLPSGDPGKQACYQPPGEQYRHNFTKIDWSK